jgi:hypothetical protein
MKIISYINNISILLLSVYIYFDLYFDVKLINIEILSFIKNYSFNEFDTINIDNNIQIITIILFSMFCYFCIYWLPACYMDKTLNYYEKICNNKKINKDIYKLMIYIPFINIICIYYLKNKYINKLYMQTACSAVMVLQQEHNASFEQENKKINE